MAKMRSAIVDDVSGMVENIVILDSTKLPVLANGKSFVPAVGVGSPGDHWNGSSFTQPSPPVKSVDENDFEELKKRIHDDDPSLTIRDHTKFLRLTFNL